MRVAIASHNLRSVAHAIADTARSAAPTRTSSCRCCAASATSSPRSLAAQGMRVRVYCPVGDLVAGMAYLVRRLLENTANESFLRRHGRGRRARRAAGAAVSLPPFANEPLLELRRAPVRESLATRWPSSTRGCRCRSRC